MKALEQRIIAKSTTRSASAAAIALGLLSGPAFAQQTPDANASAAASKTMLTGAEEIVVTAQRREQSLQKVPIAVAAFTGAALQTSGITGTETLTQVTPGLNFTRTAFFAQPYIRGVGSSTTAIGDESSIATYIDGVYVSQQQASFYDFLNVERVEVLKGPQGTLFVRNATGGAISIITERPDEDFDFRARATYGRFDQKMIQAFVNGGVANGLSASLAGVYSARDGYIYNRFVDRKVGKRNSWNLRGRAVWEPSDRLSFDLIGDVSRSDDPTGLNTHIIDRNSIGEPLGIDTTSRRYGVTNRNKANLFILNQWGVSLQSKLDLGAFDVISVTSLRKIRADGVSDSDNLPLDLVTFRQKNKARDFQEDFRLASNGSSSFDWTIGAFYFNSRTGYTPLEVNIANVPQIIYSSHQRTDAYAFYGDATIPLSSQFSLTGGLRYSHEEKTLINPSATLGGSLAVDAPTRSVAFHALTPRAVLSYTPVDDILLYASYSKGFKSGGFNQSSLTFLFSAITPPNFAQVQDPPYAPEKITAYEIGAKTRFPLGQGSATFNVSAFHYDYSDLQLQQIDANVGTAVITNAAQARMNGVDVESTINAIEGLTLRLGGSFLDAKYKSYPNAPVFVLPATCPVTTPAGAGCGNQNRIEDVTGNRLVKAPRWTVNGGFTHIADLSDGYRIATSGNVFYNGGFAWEPGNRFNQGAYAIVNAQVELQAPDQRWSIALWGKNLTDSRPLTGLVVQAAGNSGEFIDPITYGGRLAFVSDASGERISISHGFQRVGDLRSCCGGYRSPTYPRRPCRRL